MSRLAEQVAAWTWIRWGLMAFAVLTLSSGCGLFGRGGVNPPADSGGKKMHLVFTGIARLNSCGEEAGNALSVRILQLTSDGALTGLGLTQVWDHEKEELGDELIELQEVVLDPDAVVTVPVERMSNARFLAVTASFCKPEGTCWRWIRRTEELTDTVRLTFDEACVQEARAEGR
jgi:type VI secretion system VasD/TssJ family lipoprotein